MIEFWLVIIAFSLIISFNSTIQLEELRYLKDLAHYIFIFFKRFKRYYGIK